MVDFIREKTRQYAADQSGAIRQGQLAQNVSEWNSVTQKAGNLAIEVGKQMLRDKQNKTKLQEEADKNIIATQYGKTADELTRRDLPSLAAKYGVGSEAFTKAAYDLADKNYSAERDAMQTEKGRLLVDTRARATKDYIDRFVTSSMAKQIEHSKAETALKNVSDQISKDAFNQGIFQDYGDIQNKDEYKKYIMVSKGLSEEEANSLVESQILDGRLRGFMHSDPVGFAKMMGREDIVKEAYLIQHPEAKDLLVDKDGLKLKEEDNLGKYVMLTGGAVTGSSALLSLSQDVDRAKYVDIMDKSESNEKLKTIIGDTVFTEAKQAYTDSLNAQKTQFEKELQTLDARSPLARQLKDKIKDLDKKIENSDEGEALDMVRGVLRSKEDEDKLKIYDTELDKVWNEQKLSMKQDAYDGTVYTLAAGLSTDVDTARRAQTEIWLAQQGLIPMTSIESEMKSDLNGEVDPKEMYDSFRSFVTNPKVSMQLLDTYEGTMKTHDLLQKLFEPNLTPMQKVKVAYDVMNEAARSPITDSQLKTTQSLVEKILQDETFGDVVSSVLNDTDKAWFDESFVGDFVAETSGAFMPQLLFETHDEARKALPEGRDYRTTKDSVQRMIQSEGQKVLNSVMHGLVESYQLPEEQRMGAIQELQNYIVNSKKRIYNKAMKEYGIDLNYLDNELKTRGQAYAQVNGILREYKGRDSEQRAIWSIPKRDPLEKSQLARLLESISSKKSE